MTLLQEIANRKKAQAEQLRRELLARLKTALHELMPGQKVFIFGSLVREGQFHQTSDIDIALEQEPAGRSIYGLISEMEDRMDRPVDIVLLRECRFQEKITKEGVPWIS